MVSIIIPIYNTEKYLRKCLESIQIQTYRGIEVIMVNDGSTDGSERICREFLKDRRFKLMNQENSGVSVARNNGLKLATGDYILFVDSDDWMEPDMIATLVCNIEKYNVDISCCQYDHCPPNDIKEIEIWDKDKLLSEFLIHRRINGSLVNKIFKRNVIGDCKLDKNIKYGEDALFLWKISQNVSSVVMTNRILYHVSLHDDSASGGGFKSSRMDCTKVWNEIVRDTENLFPQYTESAKARRGNMAFYSWYEMIIDNYRNVEFENTLCKILKQDLKYMLKSKDIVTKVKLFSYIVVFQTSLAKKMLARKK